MSALKDIDLSDLDPGTIAALEEVARMEWTLECLKAQRRQEQFAAAVRETKAVDGMGANVMNIDAFAFHDWALKTGSYDCWNDRGFRKYIEKIAPETKVRAHGTRIQVSVPEGVPAATRFVVPIERSAKRFVKVYS